jgi:hypothetical protein
VLREAENKQRGLIRSIIILCPYYLSILAQIMRKAFPWKISFDLNHLVKSKWFVNQGNPDFIDQKDT